MPTLPVDIVNRALDECGCDQIGDLSDGSVAARAAERFYWPTLRQLLSAAHWNFARKEQPLTILADIAGRLVPERDVMQGWGYMYEWPTDCVHPRWLSASCYDDASIDIYGVTTGGGWTQTSRYPSPFIVSNAQRPNPPEGEWYNTEGHDPESTRVILCNQQSPILIYTGMMQYPDNWDPLFEQAMVSALAVRLSMQVIEDKKEARIIRADNMQVARGALDAARVRDGNEGWTVQNHIPDWIRARWSGPGWGEYGELIYSWTAVPWLESVGGVF